MEIEHYFNAASYGKWNVLQKILESGILGLDGINIWDNSTEEKYNALHYAVKEGKIDE